MKVERLSGYRVLQRSQAKWPGAETGALAGADTCLER